MSNQSLFGVVNANGDVISGSGGFSVLNTTAGSYVIAFHTPFSSIPAVVATQNGNFTTPPPSNLDGVAVGELTPTAFLASTGDSQGNPENRQFSFIAIGPVEES